MATYLVAWLSQRWCKSTLPGFLNTGGIMNVRHMGNLQEKDNIIKSLVRQCQQLEQQLTQRNVYDQFLAAGLTGALSNTHITQAGDSGGSDPIAIAKTAALMAITATDALMGFMNEKMEAEAKRQQAAKENAEKLDETKKEDTAEPAATV